MTSYSNLNGLSNLFIFGQQKNTQHQFKFKMDKAYFRQIEDRFEMTFRYVDQDLNIDRQFNFIRNLSETIDVFLTRIATNFEKIANKKLKKKKAVESKETLKTAEASFIIDEQEIPRDTICSEVFLSNKKVSLKLDTKFFEVMINPPWIEDIALPSYILTNFALYPSRFEAAFVDKSLTQFTWSKSRSNNEWTIIGEGFIYYPTDDDIGCLIKLTCLPKNFMNEGPYTEIISKRPVEAGPEKCPFEKRHEFTTKKTEGKEFRVLTYNILADLYTDSNYTRNVLFPYCPNFALSMDYRIKLLLKEIIGYNADIICLQEVDIKVYKYHLIPILSHLGYRGVLSTKGNNVAEGLGFFYNKKRFKLLEFRRIVFSEELSTNPLYCYLWVAVSKNDRLIGRVLDRATILQINVVESLDSNEILVVANTHLYFHPDADHIRLIQGGMAIKYLEHFVDNLKKKMTDKRVSLVFCGDFNSVPECGIYQLYTTGYVSGNHKDYQSNREEATQFFEVRHSFKLGSACGTPKYTNFTEGFVDCLDYIYYDKSNLEVSQVVPMPSDKEVTKDVALPSKVFPSDHIALIADLKWS